MRRLDQTHTPMVSFSFEGTIFHTRLGDTVAVALLASGHQVFRQTPISGTARGPYCMMGVCFECLVEIDGISNVQACMIELRDGMHIKRQSGAKDIMAISVRDAHKP